MSETIRKMITETHIYGRVDKTAYYINECHKKDITELYIRYNIDDEDSFIQYLTWIENAHIEKFLSLFEARYIPDKEHEFEKDREAVEEWELFAIRRANMSKPMTKANVLEHMKMA